MNRYFPESHHMYRKLHLENSTNGLFEIISNSIRYKDYKLKTVYGVK